MIDLNQKAVEIYEQNKAVGWWDNPDRCIYETLQLVVTEIAEATEGERKDLMDDHLPHRKMGEVELADALIRILDLGGRYDWRQDPDLPSLASIHQQCAGKSIVACHMMLTRSLVELEKVISTFRGEDVTRAVLINVRYTDFIDAVLFVADKAGYDVIGAMNEKLEYNKHRADHKRENRAKAGGKKI